MGTMDPAQRHVQALVDDTVPALPALSDDLLQRYGNVQDSESAAPARRLPHIWSALSDSRGPLDAADPSESGAASALIRHLDASGMDASEKMRILQAAHRALAPASGAMDADVAAMELAELLGFDNLELVTALLVKPSATAAQLHRQITLRAMGVGSAKEQLVLAPASEESEVYPNVYSSGEHGSVLSAFGSKFTLPAGTTRVHESYFEEVTIPRSKPLPFRAHERLVTLEEMDPLCRGAFRNYKSLNRLQSAVYPMAYKTHENLLVCAPTGAGKTDVAMLSVLQCVSRYAQQSEKAIHVDRNAFKIVYVAPMKALVSEVVGKFSKRLGFLGIKVRELTGDMQLTRKEIAETQMIVTTPEKWDVVTRRPTGDSDLALAVRLLIIDEVHLLHEERGAVIETIVARTQRLVESTQSMIRIVGLSATLPNYVDVADFLGVNRYRGLFYFGAAFRPVPLEQHFIGVRGKHGSALVRTNLDRIAYEKVLDLVRDNHPVMVFVHTRKDTVKSAQSLLELGREDDISSIITEGRDAQRFEKDVTASRNRELRELFQHGIGIHHAGMLRSDRDLSERLFASGATKVLFCTATLAWGVNLPAYAVVIKGTDVYDAEQGRMVDLGILDVLQIFGRAGRPQFEDIGVSYICTSGERLSHYIEAITSAHPIESAFLRGIVDALNAEVALGSVSSLDDGVSWLGFTYLFTRLRKAPLVYGLEAHDIEADPSLLVRRKHWITHAAKVLVQHGMIQLDTVTGALRPTSIGRIASKYYLSHQTMAIFSERLRNGLNEADALDLASQAADFSQISLRETEETELTSLLERVPCQVRGGTSTATAKVNILLQAHVSQLFIEDFALVSDGRYVAQNAGRVLQALFELALDRRFATSADAFLQLAKAVDRRMWPNEHPLKQYPVLSSDIQYRLATWAEELEVSQIRALALPVLAKVLHANERIAGIVHDAAERFPSVSLRVVTRPMPDARIRIDIALRRDFVWDERIHSTSVPIVVWVEDAAQRIIFADRLLLRPSPLPKDDASYAEHTMQVYMPLSPPDVRPESERFFRVTWSSLHWLAAEGFAQVPLDQVACPVPSPTTALLDAPLLSLNDVQGTSMALTLGSVAHVHTLNSMQTQVFHTMAHTRTNVLLCAPYSSGKCTVALWAVERALRDGHVMIMAPDPAMRSSLPTRLEALCEVWDVDFTCVKDQQLAQPSRRTVWLCSPSTAMTHACRGRWPPLALMLLLDVHRLDETYELAIMQCMRQAQPQRTVATSVNTYCSDSLARWLHVPRNGTFAFAQADAPYAVSTSLETVDMPYSESLVRAYIKPALDRIRALETPGLLLVPSRSQCNTAAHELMARMATSGMTGSADMEALARDIQNQELAHFVRQGIAIWHPGLSTSDRKLVVQLWEMSCLHAVLCPYDAQVPMTSALVIVLGTQYFDHASRRVREYTTDDLYRMQRYAVRPMQAMGEFLVQCQQLHAPTLEHQLRTPLTVESHLSKGPELLQAFVAEVRDRRVQHRDDVMYWLATSYLAHRIRANPYAYDVEGEPQRTDPSGALSALVDDMVSQLVLLDVLSMDRSQLQLTPLGRALPLDGIPALCRLADQALHWHTVSDQAQRVLSSMSLDDDITAAASSCAKTMLDAVGYVRPSKRGTNEPDAAAAGNAPTDRDTTPEPMRPAPGSTARLLLAQWLTAQLGGRTLTELDAVLAEAVGRDTAARAAVARVDLLVRLSAAPSTRR